MNKYERNITRKYLELRTIDTKLILKTPQGKELGTDVVRTTTDDTDGIEGLTIYCFYAIRKQRWWQPRNQYIGDLERITVEGLHKEAATPQKYNSAFNSNLPTDTTVQYTGTGDVKDFLQKEEANDLHPDSTL